MTALALIVAFACALALDVVSCAWHDARERDLVARGMVLAGVYAALPWAPFWIAISTESPTVIAADVLGAIAGSGIGFLRRRKRRAQEKADRGLHTTQGVARLPL